jgi:phosphatidylserine decarboxylase
MSSFLILGTALTLAVALPLAWKWQLGVFRTAVVVLAGSMLVAMVITAFNPLVHFTPVVGTLAMLGVTLLVCLAFLLLIFFRDPDRPAPSSTDVIVSPADGRVIYVREVQLGQVPVADKKGRSYPLRELYGTALGDGGLVAVGISMNLSDVHVNRAPIGGRVALVRHVPGTFGSLRNPEMMLSNERMTTLIKAGDLQVALVQIASRLVRRIVTFVAEGDTMQLGQRIGAIRFGSQVDLLVPAAEDIRLAVQEGDRVVAGQTIVAVVTRRAGGADPEPIHSLNPNSVNHRHGS